MSRFSGWRKIADEEARQNENKRKARYAMLLKDEELKAEEERNKAIGYCPSCHLALTPSGECMMGC